MIGKPITASSVGLSPEIVVTAPALSTIDILKNSVIVQTYTLTGAETQHTFCVPMGTYVVRAPNGSETQSKTVAVDTVSSYPIEFGSLKLYWDGNEFSYGGLSAYAYKRQNGWTPASCITLTKNASTVTANASTSNSYAWVCGTVFVENSVDVTNYSTINVTIDADIVRSGTDWAEILLCLSDSKSNDYTTIIEKEIVNERSGVLTFSGTKTVNYSASGNKYIALYYQAWKDLAKGYGRIQSTIKRIWLEK